MDILNKLQEIFRDVFDDETIILTNETTQDDIEDWDSLAQINIIVAIKKDFKIDLDVVTKFSHKIKHIVYQSVKISNSFKDT